MVTRMRTKDLRHAAVEAIEAAFPIEPVPEGNQVRNDHCPECREIATRFSVRPWPDLSATDRLGDPSPSLLTPTVFRYYLPAMLIRSMDSSQNESARRVVARAIKYWSGLAGEPGSWTNHNGQEDL
jgi:hypothetical protein